MSLLSQISSSSVYLPFLLASLSCFSIKYSKSKSLGAQLTAPNVSIKEVQGSKPICKMVLNNDPTHDSSQYKTYKICFYMYVSLYSKQEYENKCIINLEKVFDIKKDYKLHKTLFIKIQCGISLDWPVQSGATQNLTE